MTTSACRGCCARVSGNGQKLQPAAVGCGWRQSLFQIRTRSGADGRIFAKPDGFQSGLVLLSSTDFGQGRLGENIFKHSRGLGAEQMANELVIGWMESVGHRANIVGPS